MKLSKNQRESVRMMFGGMCAYCGVELSGKWHLDHVEPVYRDWDYRVNKDGHRVPTQNGKFLRPQNNRRDNLFPACIPCNISKGTCDLEGWRKWLEAYCVEAIRRNNSNFRHAERFARVIVVKEPLLFWFEKFLQVRAGEAAVLAATR
jgi:hypothetical protein